MALTFFNWEGRPAVISRSSTGVIGLFVNIERGELIPSNASWSAASATEIGESGAIVSAEALTEIFGGLPPLPETLWTNEASVASETNVAKASSPYKHDEVHMRVSPTSLSAKEIRSAVLVGLAMADPPWPPSAATELDHDAS
jgi:hypothetical protein